jgi:hypothetical protein
MFCDPDTDTYVTEHVRSRTTAASLLLQPSKLCLSLTQLARVCGDDSL